MPPPRALANEVSESEKPAALSCMCEAPNKAWAKGVNFPTPTDTRGPSTTVLRFVSALKLGGSDILRAVEAAEINHKSDPGKHLAFERPVPAVQVGAAVGRKIGAAVGISEEDIPASRDLSQGRSGQQQENAGDKSEFGD